jgi:hypothetical protein
VATRDTFDIPHLDFDSLEAGRTPVEKQTHEQRQAFDLGRYEQKFYSFCFAQFAPHPSFLHPLSLLAAA